MVKFRNIKIKRSSVLVYAVLLFAVLLISSTAVRSVLGESGQTHISSILTLSKSLTEITIGGSFDLTWSATDFTDINRFSCTLMDPTGIDLISSVPTPYTDPPGGTVNITPTVVGINTYTLSCRDTAIDPPESLSVDAPIDVKPSISIGNSFSASPTKVPSGGLSSLSWAATDSDPTDSSGSEIKCTVSANGTNILPIDRPAKVPDAGATPAVPSFDVHPTATTTYLLTCKRAKGLQSVTSNLEVKVINSLVVSVAFPLGSAIPTSAITFNIKDSSGGIYGSPINILTNLSTPPWTITLTDVPAGLYYITFDLLPGYITPEPDSILGNDDLNNKYPSPLFDSPYYSGRRIYVLDGQRNEMNVVYRRESTLKQLGHTTAETLLFDPGSTGGGRQWDLLRGVASISTDGGMNWQSSIAEVLSVGTTAQATIVKDGSHYVVAGSESKYSMTFHAEEIKGSTYAATVTDTITVPPSEDSKVTIVDAALTPTSVDSLLACQGIGILGTVGSFVPTSRKVVFNITAAPPGCEFEVTVTLKFAEDIAPNTAIVDTADIELVEGGRASDTFTTLAVGPFTQETLGGDIYARGNLNFGQIPTSQYGGKYILGAKGNVETTSSQTWLLSGYGIRSGSTADFSPDACTISGSVCKEMNDSIARLMKGADKTRLSSGSLGTGTFDLNSSQIPEGGVFYKNGDLTIGGNVLFQNKGTIIVENGNLNINGNITYDPGKPSSMLGIIVKNGSVIVDPTVANIDAIIYIYSETGRSGGSFTVNPNTSGALDIQLTIKGAVIASGKSDSGTRKDAFVLGRRFAGDPALINQAIADAGTGKTGAELEAIIEHLLQPAELFLYDSRVVVSPPPGFGGKISGSL